MQETGACGIPDVDLAGSDGRGINPADFAGHDLVILMCPSDLEAARQELASYNALADVLAFNDAYLVAVCSAEAGPPASRVSLSPDTERAWAAIGKCLAGSSRLDPVEGGVLLFGRGGSLRRVWRGVGHSGTVAEALADRM